MSKAFWLLTTHEKIELGWLTWNENFSWQLSRVSITPWVRRLDKAIYVHYRLWLWLIGFARWAFNKPVTFKDQFTKARHHARNSAAVDFEKWCKFEEIINA